MTKRISYIDALKGLAIILVVCGHIAEKSMGMDNTPFNRMYGSFHMPLFIFLSGLFAYKGMEQITGKGILNFLQKKAVRILLPFMIVGGFYSVIVSHDALAVYLGTSGGYWFLPALFYCMVLGLVQRILVGCFKMGGQIMEGVSFLLLWGAASVLWKLHCPLPYLLPALKLFPYFMAGHYFSQYNLLNNEVLSRQGVQTMAIVLYITTMIFTIKTEYHFVCLTGFFAIVILLNLFAKYSEQLPKWLSYVGKHSLEIYVLHWFFLPRMQDWGNYIMMHDSFNSNIVLTSGCCLCVCLLIIAFCLVIAKIIEQSSLLNYLCFGTKNNENSFYLSQS